MAVAGIFIVTGCSSGDSEVYDGAEPLPEVVDYNLHVRGIMSDNCYSCHGPDEAAREAELRLDTEEGAFQPLTVTEGEYAIVRGKPEESELYRRIISTDPDYKMPSPSSNLSLSDREIAILRRWIEQGAEYKPHWSFIPPEKTDPPRVDNPEWAANPIDKFVLAKLEQNALTPSPEAGKEKLLRRVSFDLTGLPPTVEELNDFLADESPEAYEKVVDRLLASGAYGERMAMEWLDVARYADTHGYQDDGPNEMWPWREWVIRAFNRNMPFDQFTTWQLAGDLLPDATREQKLATGFGRVHQQSQEGGIIGEEYRVEYVADRVNTTSKAFMGITLQCARCHDHKFDPVSINEYYEFAAFFDNINEAGQIPNEGVSGPTVLLPDEETDKMIDYLKNQIAGQEQALEEMQAEKRQEFRRWLSRLERGGVNRLESNGLIAHLDLNELHGDSIVTVEASEAETGRITGELRLAEGKIDGALEFSHSHYINLGRDFAQFERTDPFSFSFWIHPSEVTREVPVLVKTGDIFIAYRGYDVSLFENRVSLRLIHGWPYNSIQALTETPLKTDEWSHVTVVYDGSSRASGIKIYVNGEKQKTRIEQDNLFKNIVISEDAWYSGQEFLIGHRNSFEDLRYEGLKLDEIRIFDRRLSGAEALVLAGRDELPELLAGSPDEMNPYQESILFDHYLLHFDRDIKENREKLRELRGELGSLTDTLREVMVMEERLNPRQTYVRERGHYNQLGEEVDPGVPESILEFPDDLPRNRLGLARWILHPDNPLTSRVIVNRYWQMLFGEGLVDTPDDFGNQGSMPSHPKLLDWLAVDFRENGWDVKRLLRQMVMSATYRQSSKTPPELREKDPKNRLLARGPRYRLPAEMIRDNALVASGLLVRKIGGPSVKPYQPDGLWAETTSGRHLTEYIPDEGDSLYRRSLYTFWKRTSPPPGMTTFDAAMRSHPTVKRGHTSTPLQALNTLNDPQYVEASRLLAERMIKEGGENLEEQIIHAYLAATSRVPEDREIRILVDLYQEELKSYQEEPERADSLLSVGKYPVDDTLDGPELAARTLIASTILNLDETITKE
ncbi:MAG: DUF1553 domain-containing protein [Balneolaceae bacterium]